MFPHYSPKPTHNHRINFIYSPPGLTFLPISPLATIYFPTLLFIHYPCPLILTISFTFTCSNPSYLSPLYPVATFPPQPWLINITPKLPLPISTSSHTLPSTLQFTNNHSPSTWKFTTNTYTSAQSSSPSHTLHISSLLQMSPTCPIQAQSSSYQLPLHTLTINIETHHQHLHTSPIFVYTT